MSTSCQNLFAFLIATYARCCHFDGSFPILKMCDGYLATNSVTCKDRAQKLERHLACDIVQVSTNLCGQGSRQQALHHQATLLIRFDMMDTLVSRNFPKPY